MIEITDAMRRAVPAPCYQCDECMDGYSDCTCYPADMIGYVAATESVGYVRSALVRTHTKFWSWSSGVMTTSRFTSISGAVACDKPPTPLYVVFVGRLWG